MVREKATLSQREETIQTLLAWYVDVVEGWQELGRGADGFGVKMMSRAWNSRSYQELHRCLLLLRSEDHGTYWHVRERWLTGGWRTVLACPSPGCGAQENVASRHFVEGPKGRHVVLKHKHGGESVFFVLKSVPAVNAAVDPDVVTVGVRWLAARFAIEPFVPDELLAKERAA